MSAVTRIVALVMLVGIFVVAGSADENPIKKSAPQRVKLPGIVIDLQKKCLDIEATICLDKGLLELVACRKGSKEHESIVAVEAKAMHIHTGLLLLGAVNGNPAMRKQLDKATEKERWVQIPAKGDAIELFLVFADKSGKPSERPITDFIVHSRERVDEVDGEVLTAPNQNKKAVIKQPKELSNSFLFAGSQLKDNGPGPRQYLADVSGNVISIATFGDELLCLPFHQTQRNDSLLWQIKPKSLPKVGTKVVLRLRRKRTTAPKAEPKSKNKPRPKNSATINIRD